jgi:hypothetical protein
MQETIYRVGSIDIPIKGNVCDVSVNKIRFTSNSVLGEACRETINNNNVYCLDTSFTKEDTVYCILIKGGTRKPFLFKKDDNIYMLVLRMEHRVITAIKLAEYLSLLKNNHSLNDSNLNIGNLVAEMFTREMRKALKK